MKEISQYRKMPFRRNFDSPYNTRNQSAKGPAPCWACFRPVRGKNPLMVHPIEGGMVLLHPEDEHLYKSDGGDLGLHEIGSECAKKLGLEWCTK